MGAVGIKGDSISEVYEKFYTSYPQDTPIDAIEELKGAHTDYKSGTNYGGLL